MAGGLDRRRLARLLAGAWAAPALAGLLGPLAGCGPASSAAASDRLLRSPVDFAAQRRRRGGRSRRFVDAAPPEPIRNLDFRSPYVEGDDSSAEIDPAAQAAYRASMEPIQDFANSLSRIADIYATARIPNPAAAALVSRWLAAWAAAGALTEASTDQARNVVSWESATLALAWLRVSDELSLDTAERETIARWLRGLAADTRAHFRTNPGNRSRNNNHLYWAGWSNLSVALAANDADALAFAQSAFDRGLAAIREDGALPLELERRGRALQYHNFAAAPLVLMAETFTVNGREGLFEPGGPLMRLCDLTLRGLASPNLFATLTNAPQATEGIIWRSQAAWMEPYFRRTGDPRALLFLQAHRPMRAPRLGGDLTFYYSA